MNSTHYATVLLGCMHLHLYITYFQKVFFNTLVSFIFFFLLYLTYFIYLYTQEGEPDEQSHWRRFMEHTSCHGVFQIQNSATKLGQFVWSVILLANAIGLVLLVRILHFYVSLLRWCLPLKTKWSNQPPTFHIWLVFSNNKNITLSLLLTSQSTLPRKVLHYCLSSDVRLSFSWLLLWISQ